MTAEQRATLEEKRHAASVRRFASDARLVAAIDAALKEIDRLRAENKDLIATLNAYDEPEA